MMTDVPSFPTFEDAYLAQLRRTFEEPQFENAPRGSRSVERLGVAFRLEDPIQRHVMTPERQANLVFCFAEALWYLAGSDRLDVISYYAPSIRRYSEDGQTLRGTAYGPRIFDFRRSGLDQWDTVVQTLRDDPDSKRAVIQVFDGHELRIPGNIDVACTLALQFLIREGRLSAIGYMRANDAFRGSVSDVFSFTFLLELLARQLGLGVGTYTHLVGSYHVYLSDAEWVRRVLCAVRHQEPAPARTLPFPAMPAEDNWPHVHTVLWWEDALRRNVRRLTLDELFELPLPEYWQHVLIILELYRQLRHDDEVDPDLVSALHPTYRALLVTKWPRLEPAGLVTATRAAGP
jgi:thymidylate synthase